MNLMTLLREAIGNLLSNKLRSLLTMLGVFIGVGAVIAMMSIGLGAKNSITSQMSELGADSLYITPGNFTENVRNASSITSEDAAAIEALDTILSVAPIVSSQMPISSAGGETNTLSVTGVVPAYLTIGNFSLASGRFISEEDLENNALVIVIGADVKDLYFDSNEDPVGQTIRIMGQPYEIIGLLESKGNAISSSDQNIYTPLTTAQKRLMTFQRNSLDQIIMKFDPVYTAAQAEAEVSALMRSRHDIQSGDPDDFTIINMQEIVDTLNSVISTFIVFLGGVAGISLLVGGIGIMNIMLVTVTERTKEIGLRKALGAKNKDIQIQFLVESSVLSLIGGMMGIVFGYILAYVIVAVASNLGTVITPEINPVIILATTLFSITIGIFFGIYPASQAAKLEPVIALRTE